MSLLSLEQINFSYSKVPVLENLNLSFEAGRIYAIVGKSGAGKTTLLSVLSGLVSPDSGTILFRGQSMNEIDKYEFRRKYVGVIFQSFNLLTNLTALENVILSMDVAGIRDKDKKGQALALLDRVGLEREEANRRVLKLSGGQQQRVAIAQALSYHPQVILADEPTGNLDSETQQEIMKLLCSLAYEGKCVIIVTHSPTVAQQADCVYELKKNGSKKE